MDKKDKLTQIVKDVQKDKGQFELLYLAIIDKVYFWSYTVLGDEAEAKDATQEAMIKIYNKINEVKHPAYFTSWMYRLVRNQSLNHLRKVKNNEYELLYNEKTGESTENLVTEERRDHLPNEAYSLQETKKIIGSFIEELPIRQREVITLFYLEEMTIEEISKVLDYNSGSVRSRLHSGRKNLEKKVNEYQEEHNVKLYSTALLPLLLLLFKDYKYEVCAKQDLSFDKNKFREPKVKGVPKKIIVISTLIVSIVTILLLLNSTKKEISKSNGVGIAHYKNNLSIDSQKKGWVTVSGGEVTERGGKTSITYTFEVADGPLTALHGHLYWDPNLMEYDSSEKDNIKDWIDEKNGHLEFMNIDSAKNEKSSITIYFKNVLPEDLPQNEIPIRFEFEDETSINQPDRELVTFSGGDYLAMEPDEVVIPVEAKVKYIPNAKDVKGKK